MPLDPPASERLVCAVLAAQVAALRDRIDTGPTVTLLWQTSDALARIAGLVERLASLHADLPESLRDDCTSALASGLEVIGAIDGLAFEQAQRNDFTCQTVDCVVVALGRLAVADKPLGLRLPIEELAALYVCEEQRAIHDIATRQFGVEASRQSVGGNLRHREGLGK